MKKAIEEAIEYSREWENYTMIWTADEVHETDVKRYDFCIDLETVVWEEGNMLILVLGS